MITAHSKTILVLALAAVVLPCFSSAASSLSAAPFYTRHLNPFVQVYGLPAAEGGRLTPEGKGDFRLILEAGNESRSEVSNGERLVLDGETYRGTLAFRYGLSSAMELGIDVPMVGHAGGIFDGFISGWHDFFNFPNGNRDEVDNNELLYFYAREGDVLAERRNDTAGLGDVQLFGAFRLTEPGNPRQAALRLGVKLPTGDRDRLLGSGSTDVSLRLAATDPESLAKWDITLFGEAGVVRLGDGDILDDLRRRWVGTGNFGLAWDPPLDGTHVKIQGDAHTAVFRDSALEPVESWALQLVAGLSFDIAEEAVLDVAVSENIVAETAPDVAFHLALRKRF